MGFKYQATLKNLILCGCLLMAPVTSLHAYDFSTGVFQFQQKLAIKGDSHAQYKLANMYENGQGTKINLEKALKWYKKSAAQNYSPAKMHITYLEIKKTGFKSSKHKAWLKKLVDDAAANDGESLYLLAGLYKKGFIVRKDLKKSAELFKKASNVNVPGAESELESVETLLYAQKAKQRAREKQRRLEAERSRKEQQQRLNQKKSNEERNKQLATQRAERERLATERERMYLAQEKQKLLEEKKHLQERRRILLLKQAEAEKEQPEPEAQPEPIPEKKKFDRSICKGKKARFLTICR